MDVHTYFFQINQHHGDDEFHLFFVFLMPIPYSYEYLSSLHRNIKTDGLEDLSLSDKQSFQQLIDHKTYLMIERTNELNQAQFNLDKEDPEFEEIETDLRDISETRTVYSKWLHIINMD